MLTDATKLHSRRRAISLGARLYNADEQTSEEDVAREDALREHILDLPDALRLLALAMKARMRHVPRDYDQQIWRSRAWGFRLSKDAWRPYSWDEAAIRKEVREWIAAARRRLETAAGSPLLARSNMRKSSSESA